MDFISFDWEGSLHAPVNRGVFEDYYSTDGHPIPILFKLLLADPTSRALYITYFQYLLALPLFVSMDWL